MASDVRPANILPVTEVEFEQYDVFLCHRGPDTKIAFVSYLYDRLEAAGMRPFLDCKSIGKGQDSQTCIDHVVKTTPIALVIFSENFADSKWCLNELEVMLDTDPGVKVLPVFYKVQPDDVGCPEKGRLSAAFDKLKLTHDETTIKRWRDVLKRASELNGWVYEAAGPSPEPDLVKAIVREVSELANKPLLLDVGDYVFGTKKVVDGIIQKHKEVSILVLWGVGGIGKSTLAIELYNRLRGTFAASCYVDLKSYYHVEDSKKKVIRDKDIVKVQKHILEYLCPNGGKWKLENKSIGKRILEERLSKKRILLVLDDVPDNGELYYWISSKMLTKGSMCIVTTRNRRVVEKLNNFDMKKAVHVHNVQGLGSEDSEHVFASYAFGGYWNDKPPGFEELVAKISEACRGVPLVLKVCGALLKGREDASFWNEVLKELRRGTFDDDGRRIFECLMISYNALPQECQEMFLDIACALLGKPKDMAILAWKSHGWSPIKGIEILVERALVTVDNSGGFKMHDHLRDMGRQIVREQRSKGVITRLSMPESLEYLRQNEGFPESLEILIIFNVDSSSLCSLDTSHMKKLRILMFDDTIAPTSIPESLCWCHLYGLWFNRCFKESAMIVMRTLPTPLPNSKLVVLSLAGSHITMLPEIVVRLSSLEVLNLKGCEKRCFLPESKPCLLPESFGGLKKLRDLDLEASGIISLPESFGELSNLEVLNLRRCRELYMLPESFGGLRKLRDLNLEDSGITSLPASFGKLSNLEVLNPGTLYLLPESFGGARKLRGLNLKGSRIRSLPASFGGLINLEVLNLWQCGMLLFLPESFGGLRKLQDLNLDGSGIRSLPSSFGELSNLEVLDLRRCTELHLLPESFGGLRKLRDLNLEGSGITSLPASFGELSNLEVLDLRGCKKLLFLPSSLTGLKNVKNFGYSGSAFEKLLQTLGCLTGFEESSVSLKLNTLQNLLGIMKTRKELMLEFFAIEALPESFGELSNLEVLNLRGCRELQLLPELFGSLRMLRDLDLDGTGITSLPASFGKLSNLEVLNLRGCWKLFVLPESFWGLRMLRDLNLDGTGITSLPASFGKLSNLEVLNLRGCWKLFVLPESFWGLSKLRDLNLGATGIRSLPSSFGEVSNLVVLNLEGCRIPSLPAVFGELSNLEVLNLSRCRELHLLPKSFGVLKKLRDLNLKASGIKSLPSSFGKLSNLVVLNLEGCKIPSLSVSFGELSNLEMLNLRGCEELHLMPESSGGLRKLRDLELSPYHEAFRDEILGLPASFGELSNLEMLNLLQCWELQLLPESFGGLR